MKQLPVVNLFFLSLFIFPHTTFAQNKEILRADIYFVNAQYQNSLSHYQKALHKNKIWHRKNKYDYFRLLFQIAESKRFLNDTNSNTDYRNILDEYSKIHYPENLQIDQRILLFVAESEKNLQNFSQAESYYKLASDRLDSIDDFFKFGYAFCSLKQNRYGQALQLLNEIKERKHYDPQFSEYMAICNTELAKNITRDLKINDTLNLLMNYRGCFGGMDYRYSIVKQSGYYKLISYNEKRAYDPGEWQIDTVKTLSDSAYAALVNFENEMRNYNQYKNTMSCTSWAEISFQSGKDNLQIKVHDCALGIGEDIQKVLSKK
jgi:tetratricopeptide (TPR) repeat protein